MSAQPALTREEWLAARRHHVTATDIAAILGVHPYVSPRLVYLDKRGELPEQAETDAMWLGTYLEDTVAKRFAQEMGKEPVRAVLEVKKDEPLFAATCDFLVGDDELLECKTAGAWAANNFGIEGTDDVPVQYLCQAQWQLFVTGRKVCHLWVLRFSPTRFGRYVIKADPKLHTTMAHQARKWWNEHIVQGCPPPLSGAECDTRYVEQKAPLADGSIIAASEDIEDACAELGNVRQELAQVEARKAALENQIKDFMGEAQVLKTSSGDFKWGNRSRSGIDTKRLALEFPDIAKELATTTTFRAFTTPFRSEKA